jgi:hypothetical protein
LRYIGKTVQNFSTISLQKQILPAFCHSPRHSGGLQCTHLDHFADAIKIIIPELTKDAPLKLWGNKAKDREEWNSRIKKWWQDIRNIWMVLKGKSSVDSLMYEPAPCSSRRHETLCHREFELTALQIVSTSVMCGCIFG